MFVEYGLALLFQCTGSYKMVLEEPALRQVLPIDIACELSPQYRRRGLT